MRAILLLIALAGCSGPNFGRIHPVTIPRDGQGEPIFASPQPVPPGGVLLNPGPPFPALTATPEAEKARRAECKHWRRCPKP